MQCSLAATVPVCQGKLATLQLDYSKITARFHYMALVLICVPCSRTSSGQQMALKIASLDSSKHHNLKHQKSCLMALHSLWGQCVPHVLLAGVLSSHGHGYGLGTTLLQGRHPSPGTNLLLAVSKCSLNVRRFCFCCIWHYQLTG